MNEWVVLFFLSLDSLLHSFFFVLCVGLFVMPPLLSYSPFAFSLERANQDAALQARANYAWLVLWLGWLTVALYLFVRLPMRTEEYEYQGYSE